MPLIASIARIFSVLILAIPLVGSRGRTQQITDEYVRIHRSPELTQLMELANQHFQAGEFALSASSSQRGLALAKANRDDINIALFLSNLGSYYIIVHRYADALRAFEESNRVAIAINFRALALRNVINLATLYRRMGDTTASIEVMRRLNGLVPAQPPSEMFAQAANVYAAADFARSVKLYRAAVNIADEEGKSRTQALYWNQLGYGHLLRGELGPAESALIEAFRIRRLLSPQSLGSSYMYLGMLRIAQGDAESAINLLNSAIAMSQKSRLHILPSPLYYQRGRAEAMRGNLQAAFADYEKAIELARKWRLDVLPADEFRISVEATLQKSYSAYIQAGMELSFQNYDRLLANRMWEALEENRSSSLRDGAKSVQNLPVIYWETMAALRAALPGEVAGDANATSQVATLRLKLSEIEAQSGAAPDYSPQTKERSSSDNPLIRLQRSLINSEVLISFHIGVDVSYAWAITQLGVEVKRLPGRADIDGLAKEFRRTVEKGEDSALSGSELFTKLFGSFSRSIHDRREWLLSLDEPLLDIPFAALVEKSGSDKQEFLVEKRSVRLLPGALSFARPETGVSHQFAGIGDPVYNVADPRREGNGGHPVQQYPRLPGSGREVRVAAVAWKRDSQPVLLTGTQVTREALRSVLQSSPGIAHFALHVVQNPKAPEQVFMALGLRGADPAYLAPSEIAADRVAASLIVLSGCGSGTGKALPGAGLLGLTRAWLAAGAQSVTATYWPIPDDAEAFFQQYYSALDQKGLGTLGARSSAEALRVAQIHMLKGGGGHASPRYWSAFFTVGKG